MAERVPFVCKHLGCKATVLVPAANAGSTAWVEELAETYRKRGWTWKGGEGGMGSPRCPDHFSDLIKISHEFLQMPPKV